MLRVSLGGSRSPRHSAGNHGDIESNSIATVPHTSNSGSSTSSYSSNDGGSTSGLVRRFLSNFHDNDDEVRHDNCSDSDTCSEESRDYLFNLKCCSVVAIIGYIYRSILPVPVWIDYFGTGMGGNVFQFVYIGMKIVDLSWKARGAVEAIEHFLTNKLVR